MLDPEVDNNDTGLGFLDEATELKESNSPTRLFRSRTVRLDAPPSSSVILTGTAPTLAGALVGLLLLVLSWLRTIVFDSALIATILGCWSDLRPNCRGIVVGGDCCARICSRVGGAVGRYENSAFV